MRIIGGTAKGKKLAVFSGGQIRPTPDRVREAIFSIIFSRLGSLSGKSVLDLFAGTGAMAIEAMSRGAERAILIDQGDQAASLIPANLKACGMEQRGAFFRADVPSALPRLAGDCFDLIFLDPPYGRSYVPSTVEAISRLRLLAPGGLICAEAEGRDEIPDACGDLVRVDRRDYGSTGVHLFTHRTSES
jgi:16S rRNA (guanine(966)-N(2))-methyltransferase RsmD